MNTAIAERRTVHRAMFNHNLDGCVDFEWGDDGLTKPFNKKGEPVGKGISHIIEARMRKDGMSYEQVVRMLTQDIVETIAKGRVHKEAILPDGKVKNVQLDYNGHRAVLIKKKGNNGWILTAFELHSTDVNSAGSVDTERTTNTKPTLTRQGEGAVELNSNGGQRVGFDTTEPTHSKPTRTHQGMGAFDTNNVQQSEAKRNQQDAEQTRARELLRRALGQHADKIELVRDEQFGENDTRRGAEGWYHNGKLYLNLDGITDGRILSKDERLVWVAWHELGHHGVEVQFSQVLKNQLHQARKNVVVNGIAKRIFAERQAEAKRENNPSLAISQDVATEEAIVELFAAMETGNWAEIENRYRVHIVQEWRQPQSDLVKRLSHLANFFKRLVARITGKNLDAVSNQEVLNLLATVKQGIAKSAENSTASDTRYSFAGENAQNADHSSLEKAKADMANGKDAETVRKETGWFKGIDGKWRFELDSSQAKLNSDVFEPTEKLGERRFIGLLGNVLNYPQLLEAYPDLAQTPVSLRLDRRLETADTNGSYVVHSYSPLIEEIRVNANNVIGERGLKSILLHEIQHAIQRRENFARGGNPDSFTETTEGEYYDKRLTELLRNTDTVTRDLYHAYVNAEIKATNAVLNNESESVQAQANEELEQADKALLARPDGRLIQEAYFLMGEDETPVTSYEQYRRLAGETESRNIQSRMDMTAEERRNTSPESTEDVPRYQQAVRFDNNRAAFALREDADSDFAKAVDIVTNKLNALKIGEQVNGYPNQPITLGTTPDVLKMLGYSDVDVQIGWGTVEKIMRQHFDLPRGKHSNIHNLSPDVVKQIPQQLNNPVAIYESGTKDGALVVLTELSAVEKATGKESPVVVALHFAEDNGHLELINIASAYERNANKIAYDDLNKRKVLYVNKAKGQKLTRNHPSLQLASAFSEDFDPSSADIKTETDLSQYQSENSDVRYSRKAPKQDTSYQRDLMVTHNISAKGIMHAKKMGGLPFASVAVAKQSNPLTGFGEVTLIGDRDYIDPKGANKAEVYGTDIHSKRYEHDNEGTLDEVIAEMKAHYRRNSNNYDSSSLRNSVQKSTPQFESITDIQNNKSRLVSQEDYDAAFDALNNQAVDLARTLKMSYLDVLNNISALAHPDVEMAAELIEDIFPNADTLEKQKTVKNMLESLHNMPSTYFEGKAKDVTQFSDFSGAVVPNNLPKNAYDVLQQAGLKIYEYDPDVENSRAEIIKQATNELDEQSGGNILFSRKARTNDLDVDFENATPKRTANSFEEARAAVTELLGEPLVNRESGMIATISKRSLEKLVSGKATKKSSSTHDHLMAVANVDQLFENATQGWVEPHRDDDPNIAGIHRLFAPLNIDGKMKLVKLTVKEMNFNQDNRIYSVETIEVDNGTLGNLEATANQNDQLTSPQSANIRSLIQRIQDFNSRDENSEPLFSRKQTSMEILTDGKVKHETLWGTVKAGEFGKIWNEVQRKTDFAFTDETRPVLDWIGDLELNQVQENELKVDFELADGVRHSLNSQLMQRFLKPLHKNIVNLAKKRKKDIEWTKKALGIWVSANYSIQKNQELLARDEQAMLDAKQAFDEAKANGTNAEIDKAERAYIRAERQYRYRKHDVELNNWEVDEKGNFIVPRKVGVAGFSIPHAKALMAEVEKYFSQKEVLEATKPLREAVKWNIHKNREFNRITEEQFKEYMRNLDYVPLTGDPDSLLKDDDDFIGGASSKGVNTSRDKNMKGRVNSEAEDAIDAVYRMLDKTVANAAWQPFKNGIDAVYEQKLSEAKAQGMTEEQAKEHVADTVGIRRQVMQGTTRTNDEVLIRKFGNVYYEYRLPEDVIKAIKGGQRDIDEFKVWQHFPMRYVRKLTGLYAQGVTQFKLPFAPKNMIRDIWEKSALITTRDIYDTNGNPLSQKEKNRIGSRTFAALANPAEMARVLRATGRLAKGDTENLDVNNEYQRDLKELIELGGVSNYSTYLARTDKDLVEEIKKLDKPHHRAVEGALHLVAVWNGTF
nr:LPD23 domain-containing protein [uncultured Haemophilus sp.]